MTDEEDERAEDLAKKVGIFNPTVSLHALKGSGVVRLITSLFC